MAPPFCAFRAPTYGTPSAHRVRAGATQGGRAKAGMRRSLLLIALTIAGVMAGTRSASAADPAAADPDCSVYSQPCIFLEAQSWWLHTPGATRTDFGHVHVGTCFPYLQNVSDSVRHPLKLHNNPGRLYHVDSRRSTTLMA
jgi:hypothetical protein